VTALVVAILLAVVLVPVGAQAAQVVSAIITDPGGTNKARVDASGNLQIGGEVTVGNQAASPVPVAPQGTTMVEGSVAAQPALAGTSLADTISLDTIHPGGSSSDKFFGQNFSENQRVAVTSLTFDNEIQVGAATVGILIQALHPISGECGGNGGTAFEVGPPLFVHVGPEATLHLDFPYPFVSPTSPSGDWCLRAHLFNSGQQVAITAVGYLVETS